MGDNLVPNGLSRACRFPAPRVFKIIVHERDLAEGDDAKIMEDRSCGGCFTTAPDPQSRDDV
jgi:hypothetical protein